MSEIKDSQSRIIKEDDICFYTERPHNNYADSIVQVYLHAGILKVGTLVVHGLNVKYVNHKINPLMDLDLQDYTRDYALRVTDTADGLTVIDDVNIEDITIEYANINYPLSK